MHSIIRESPAPMCLQDSMEGLIIKALSGFYYVETEEGIIECKARGRFRNSGTSLLVGDRVEVATEGGKGVVYKVLNRKNHLERPPIANIDKLFIVSSAVTPAPNCLLIDRLTALAEFKNITPIIIFNKNDEGDISDYVEKYSKVGYKTIECSAKTGYGCGEIKALLADSISAFTGNSGVGKSSILNLLFPELSLSTGEISEKLGRGRHTTRHTELFRHKYNGYVADTPGFSSLEADVSSLDFKEDLINCFPEFSDYSGLCRFSDCKHIGENGCAVKKAVDQGKIEVSRLESYITIHNELKDLKHWNI